MKEKGLDITPRGDADGNRNFVPLNSKCDDREKDWASESKLKLHKRVYHAKITRVQPVMRRQDEIKMKDAVSNRSVKDLTANIIEIKSTDERRRSSLRHLQAGFEDQFELHFKKHKSLFKTT